jgi:hypothetical protein
VRPARVSASSDRTRHVVVINPLGGALHDYTLKLLATLHAAEINALAWSIDEPSVAGTSSVRWLFQYFRLLVSSRPRRGRRYRVLVTWPVLGHWDRIIVPLLTGARDAEIVMHDPRPLVRARGYGSMSVGVVRMLAPSGNLIVHSALAQADLKTVGVGSTILPHPIIASLSKRQVPARKVLRVLGQWKPDRDVDLLAQLAGLLPNVDREIVGRRWPAVEGWRVHDAFASEEELDVLIGTSSAVLIPYQRFYQSGIAARAIEAAVPVVGRRPELSSMTGADYPFLVDAAATAADWAKAISAAIASDPSAVEATRTIAAARSERAWEEWGKQ